jgi:hypothetical protein
MRKMGETHDPSVGVRHRHQGAFGRKRPKRPPSFAREEAKLVSLLDARGDDRKDHDGNACDHDVAATAGTSSRTSCDGSLMRNSAT